jgi:hypothetical protein
MLAASERTCAQVAAPVLLPEPDASLVTFTVPEAAIAIGRFLRSTCL